MELRADAGTADLVQRRDARPSGERVGTGDAGGRPGEDLAVALRLAGGGRDPGRRQGDGGRPVRPGTGHLAHLTLGRVVACVNPGFRWSRSGHDCGPDGWLLCGYNARYVATT